MKCENLVSEVEPFGWIVSGMTVKSEFLFYHGLACNAFAVQDKTTGKWDARLKVSYPMFEPVEEDDSVTGQFWRNYSEPFETSEEAISVSLELGKKLVDGEQVGLNDFLNSKVTDQMLDDLK
mgnify:CR=1 FL=1